MGVRCEFGSVMRCDATFGVSSFIVLNLGILKSTFCFPIRSDQNHAGPLEVTHTHIARMSIGTQKSTRSTVLSRMSKIRFNTVSHTLLYQFDLQRNDLLFIIQLYGSLSSSLAKCSSPIWFFDNSQECFCEFF